MKTNLLFLFKEIHLCHPLNQGAGVVFWNVVKKLRFGGCALYPPQLPKGTISLVRESLDNLGNPRGFSGIAEAWAEISGVSAYTAADAPHPLCAERCVVGWTHDVGMPSSSLTLPWDTYPGF